jgi:hypothetical protein
LKEKSPGFVVQFVALRKRTFAKRRLAAEIRPNVQFCTNRVVTPVAKFSVGLRLRKDEMTSQAATWNSPAMNSAWTLMSLPPMFRTCPFLIIAIAS